MFKYRKKDNCIKCYILFAVLKNVCVRGYLLDIRGEDQIYLPIAMLRNKWTYIGHGTYYQIYKIQYP